MSDSCPIIGIRREDKNKWERRVPLTPEHVRTLIQRLGVKVLVQPSNLRVFSNDAYVDAGAELTEDLSPAEFILAVKEVPIPLLIPGRTYFFFSHTIKAQKQNMPLLDALIAKRVRLIDYECITVGGQRGGKRLVAFGRYAGIAGMVDFLRGLGERFLSLGYGTPFLNVAAMYMYPDIEHAKAAIKECGDAISLYGLPSELCPFTVVVTGNGNVAQGALEVLGMLPVRLVDPFDLESIVASATGADRTHCIYVAVAKDQHMVTRRAPGAGVFNCESPSQFSANGSTGDLQGLDVPPSPSTTARALAASRATTPFDPAHYRAHPEAYKPIFHAAVLPYASVVVNSMYWDSRFPRLISCRQVKELSAGGCLRLLGVCDISCDLRGSIEFLLEFTSIEKPFYIYDVASGSVLYDLAAPGVLYHAVDHLPSECPKDASAHFGACLLPLLPSLLRPSSDGLPAEVSGAIICEDGALTPSFDYITALRASSDRADKARSHRRSLGERALNLSLEGHLFDTGILSRVLDLVEDSGDASAKILHCSVGKDRSTPTRMLLRVLIPNSGDPMGVKLAAMHDALAALTAEAGVTMILDPPSQDDGLPTIMPAPTIVNLIPTGNLDPAPIAPRRILVLGSGFVSAPLVEYLLRRPENSLTITSVSLAESERLAAGRPRCTALQVDVAVEDAALGALVAQNDIVISLLPAPFHPQVARHAIQHRRNMITASYVSPELASLQKEAAAAGIVILCECGVDPGIDHMSALELMDGLKTRGGVITSFSSVCGGLPAPEASNNPLGYKFSWSPRGALIAMRNAASYLHDAAVVTVPGADLLTSAQPFHINPAFSLEVIPNRDSMPYAEKYRIAGPALRGMSRGTLRYGGFCANMAALTALGFLGTVPEPMPPVPTLRGWFSAALKVPPAADDEELMTAAISLVAASARKSVDSYSSALPPALAEIARDAASVCTNHQLDTNPLRQASFRRFISWCGFFSERPLPPPGTAGPSTRHEHVPIDTLVSILVAMPEMSFGPGERDMIIMQHVVEASFPDGHTERHTASLIEYANARGQTAMARTVGLTAGIAAQLVLDNAGGMCDEGERGIIVPLVRSWYHPILTCLRGEGIALRETMVRSH